jgi:hypothetical protein
MRQQTKIKFCRNLLSVLGDESYGQGGETGMTSRLRGTVNSSYKER